MSTNRPTWDAYFLAIAHAVATRSPCVKRQVGAVLVSDDRAILATGYNGPPRGAPHRDETTCVRVGIPSGERADVVCCAHAEINAIAQAARHGVPVKGSTLYVTTSPCAWCARSIVNAGVVRVVREGDYADAVAATVFAESNVPIEQIEAPEADDAPPGHYYVERLAFIARNGDSPIERVLVKRETDVGLEYTEAFAKGQDDGVRGTLRAITSVLDSPPENVDAFGDPGIQVIAERLRAMRAELWATHTDLGEKVEELEIACAAIPKLHRVQAELEDVRRQWAANASALRAGHVERLAQIHALAVKGRGGIYAQARPEAAAALDEIQELTTRP